MTQNNIRRIKPFQPIKQQAGLSEESVITPQEPVITMTTQEIAAFDSQTSLADRKFELSRLKEELEVELAQIDAELKQQLHEGDIVPTQHGIGYKLTVANHEVYDRRVIAELSKMRLLPKFVRVSTTKLKELVSEGRLSMQKFNHLREYATTKEITTLREVPLANAQAS
ncbi:MAG: hypothetical protein K0Q50_3130 [Vampirovibrio sp.]|nr:hypothetical protein [Vampirovibrio sp.]